MRRLLVVLASLMSGVAMLDAQRGMVPGSVSGRVVDAATGEGLSFAVVNVAGPRGQSTARQVLTDSTGGFSAANVPPGRLSISAFKQPGYMGGGYAQRDPSGPSATFDLNQGEKAANVVLRLWRMATISGTVTDSTGAPSQYAAVYIHRVQVIGGELALDAGRKLTTDYAGSYASGGLSPAKYVVSVWPSPASVRQYVPGVANAEHATILDLTMGGPRRDVDIKLQRLATVPVSGMVLALAGLTSAAEIALYPDVPSPALRCDFGAVNVPVRDGAFTFPSVLPGRYVIRARQFPLPPGQVPDRAPRQGTLADGRTAIINGGRPFASMTEEATLWAEVPINVGTEPLNDVVVRLQPGARIAGNVVFDGASRKPVGEQLLRTAVLVTSPTGGPLSSFQPARLELDGSFLTVGLPPGVYGLVLAPGFEVGKARWADPWRSRSIEVGSRVSPGGLVEVGATDVHVVLTLTDGELPSIQGTVRDRTGNVRPDASVFVVPVARRSWPFRDLAKETRPGRFGAYALEVEPGEYFVVASTTAPALWRELAVLDSLVRSATTVRLGAGEERSLDLTVAGR